MVDDRDKIKSMEFIKEEHEFKSAEETFIQQQENSV
jgi:hypothetical protein